jgi:hypothetical protein
MRACKLYDHEKRYKAMRDAGPELYEALSDLFDLFQNTMGEARRAKVSAVLAKVRGDNSNG